MKFGTGSTTELTQKREGQSTKMPYVRPNIYINKQTSPIFNYVTPVSVSLATLARQLCMYVWMVRMLFKRARGELFSPKNTAI